MNYPTSFTTVHESPLKTPEHEKGDDLDRFHARDDSSTHFCFSFSSHDLQVIIALSIAQFPRISRSVLPPFPFILFVRF